MGKKTDIKTCRYINCNHPNKKIDITTDKYVVVGKTMYYHADCLKEKRSVEWKDDQTKRDLQYIKNQWVLHIDKAVVYSQLFKVLNEFLARGISSEYLVFVLDYVIKHKMKLNYPNGLKYYVERQEIKNAYRKSKLEKIDHSKFKIETVDEPEDVKKPNINITKPKGFASILQNKKQED